MALFTRSEDLVGVPIEGYVTASTERAVCITEDPPVPGRTRRQEWFPRSQIKNYTTRRDRETHGGREMPVVIATFDCPEWLATDKGFL